MAKKKVARKQARKPVRKPAARKTAKRPAKKAVKRVVKKVVKKVAKKVAKKAAKKAPTKKAVRKITPKRLKRQAVTPQKPPARLQRDRRRLPEAERESFTGSGADTRLLNSARSGHDELRSELRKYTGTGPELTAGDVDANWQDAYAVGDEAPGGDNPTPDQDRVDDIGRALGVEYDDDQELMGGEEIAERDAHRWELDPASREDE